MNYDRPNNQKVSLKENLEQLQKAVSANLIFTVDEYITNIFNVFFTSAAMSEEHRILKSLAQVSRHFGNDANAAIIEKALKQFQTTEKLADSAKNKNRLKPMLPEKIWFELQDLVNDANLKDDIYIKYLYSFEKRFANSVNDYNRIRTYEKSTTLDIGTGMGYVPYLLKRNGHQSYCIDVKSASKVFDASCKILQVNKIDFSVEKYKKLMDFGVRFDIINSNLICFNNHLEDDLWGEEEWLFFLNDL